MCGRVPWICDNTVLVCSVWRQKKRQKVAYNTSAAALLVENAPEPPRRSKLTLETPEVWFEAPLTIPF